MDQPQNTINIIDLLKMAAAEITLLQSENTILKEQIAAVRTITNISKSFELAATKVRTESTLLLLRKEIQDWTRPEIKIKEGADIGPIPPIGPGEIKVSR